MDYKDYLAGKKNSDFWIKGKNGLIETLINSLKPKEKSKILSIGAGTGDDLEILNRFGDVYVIDIEKKALNLIKKGSCFKKKVCDACNLDFPDNYFDIVTSFDVFEHIEKDSQAVSEVFRVLKKGGSLVFSVPAFQFLFSSHDQALNHFRRYSKKEAQKLFSNFKNKRITYWNFFLFPPIALLRLVRKNSKPQVDNPSFNPILNNAFYKLLKAENSLIRKRIKLPFGLSIAGVCEK